MQPTKDPQPLDEAQEQLAWYRDELEHAQKYFDPPLRGFREHPPLEAKGFSYPIPVVAYDHQPS